MKHIFLILSLLIAFPVYAVQPDEILDDPVLEERARELSKGLRCLVCQNESIDDSDAALARDLRILVRDRLVAGDSDEEVLDFVVDRYGEFALLQPKFGGSNLILWIAGPLGLIFALFIGLNMVRRSSTNSARKEELSADEADRLNEILNRD
jgi:cytochrome c-type biogenesis protein CcmH